MRLRDEMQIEFTIAADRLAIIDAVPVPRSARAAVQVVVALAKDGVIDRREALNRIAPRTLNEVLHPLIDPATPRERIVRGIAASPGAAAGKLVFSSTAAQAMAARARPASWPSARPAPRTCAGCTRRAGC